MTNKTNVLSFARRGWAVRLLAALGLLWGAGIFLRTEAQAAPAAVMWPNIYLTQVASGLTQPVHITHSEGDPSRLYVVEQPGRIRIVQNGLLLSTPFLNLSATPPGANRVYNGGSEQGLLSVAFPPGYPAPPQDHFYVFYTTNNPSNCDNSSPKNCDNVVERYRLTADPNVADPNDHDLILTIPHQLHSNHNGGQLAFGPNDGYLYISTGDGGGGGDPEDNAQNLNELSGKILRIHVDTNNPPTYTVPPTNPFFGPGVDGLDEIWAWGLRNPWRFSFDSLTADLYIGDVGQGAWEEVDFQPATSTGGENYGWDCREGKHTYSNPGHDCSGLSGAIDPVAEYDHGLGCSVTGGFVYRGTLYDRMKGVYFYGDYCSGRIWGLQRDGLIWVSTELENTPYLISSFGEDDSGELYFANHGAGTIYRISGDWISYFPIVAKN